MRQHWAVAVLLAAAAFGFAPESRHQSPGVVFVNAQQNERPAPPSGVLTSTGAEKDMSVFRVDRRSDKALLDALLEMPDEIPSPEKTDPNSITAVRLETYDITVLLDSLLQTPSEVKDLESASPPDNVEYVTSNGSAISPSTSQSAVPPPSGSSGSPSQTASTASTDSTSSTTAGPSTSDQLPAPTAGPVVTAVPAKTTTQDQPPPQSGGQASGTPLAVVEIFPGEVVDILTPGK